MSTTQSKTDSANGSPPEFHFFPPGMTHTPGEGRDPRVPLEKDPVIREFPTGRQIGWFVFGAALVVYLISMSWFAFPGVPTWALLECRDPHAAPVTMDFIWMWLIRGFAHLPVGTVAGWAGIFSAICGAASVGLLAQLMLRVGYLIRNEPGQDSFVREAQARRLSGVVAALYLALSIPFWVAATRSLPDSFHLLLLLWFAWYVSEYQHWGKKRHLFMAGLLLGIGLSEFPTFIVFLPLALFHLIREMFRWRVLRNWRMHGVFWGGLILGLLVYLLNAFVYFKQNAWMGTHLSPPAAVQQVLGNQFRQITQIRFSPGFLAIIAISVVPWLTLFAMSSRSPWFYEWGQVSVRLIFVCGLVAILYNVSFAPWHLLGMSYLMVTPYLLLAVSAGYMAGEFWILGETQALLDTMFVRRTIRRASSLFALLFPAVILLGGALNWRVVDGRYSRLVAETVDEVFRRLGTRDILFSTGLLDDSLCLAVLEQDRPVHIISAPRTGSSVYLAELAKTFKEDILALPLSKGDFGTFLDNLLMSDTGPGRIGIIDMPDVFREFGYMAPDALLYRLEAAPERIDVPGLVASQQPFWRVMEHMAQQPVPAQNILRPFQDFLRLMASKVANNLAYVQITRGDESGALDTLETARRIDATNLSVLLNLLELSHAHELKNVAELEADWTKRQIDLGSERWILAVRFGYVWNARAWVRRGFVWALSGVPAVEEAARRKPAISTEDEASNDNRMQIIDQAYLQWGLPFMDDTYYRSLLMKDSRDTTALLAMCRLALRRNDTEAAEAYIGEARAVGLDDDQVRFDEAMVEYVRGDKAKAIEDLHAIGRRTPGDMRVWMALLLLTDEDDPANDEALKVLKDQGRASIGQHLALASVHMARQQWAAAQNELDATIQQDPRNSQAWEMMVLLAQQRGNKALLDAGMQALLVREPDHFLQYQNAGVEAYRKEDWAQAEAMFRKGIMRRRDAVLLNNLADVIMQRDGDLQDALKLVNEALLRQPGQAQILCTRGEVLLRLGRYAEALQVLQESLRKQGRTDSLLLLLAEAYEGLGDRKRAMTVAKALLGKRDTLSRKQQIRLKDLQVRLEEPLTAAEPGQDGQLALERVNTALQNRPGDGELLGQRGEIQFRLQQYEEARRDLSDSLRQQAGNFGRWILLAQTYERLGDSVPAAAIARKLAGKTDQLSAAQQQEVQDLLRRLPPGPVP